MPISIYNRPLSPHSYKLEQKLASKTRIPEMRISADNHQVEYGFGSLYFICTDDDKDERIIVFSSSSRSLGRFLPLKMYVKEITCDSISIVFRRLLEITLSVRPL